MKFGKKYFMEDKIINILMNNVHEYNEEMDVYLKMLSPEDGEIYKNCVLDNTYNAYMGKRIVIKAFNQAGYDSTEVDLIELLTFVKKELPEIWQTI